MHGGGQQPIPQERRALTQTPAQQRKTDRQKAKRRQGAIPVPPPREYGNPGVPSDLSACERKHWHVFAELLDGRGQLAMDSVPSMRRLCAAAAEVEELGEDVKSNGRFHFVADRSGIERESARPAYVALQAAETRLMRWLAEFGLTDVSRNRVSGNPSKGQAVDPAAEFLG